MSGEFDAETAAYRAANSFIDEDPSRELLGCTPSMVVGVALNAYRATKAKTSGGHVEIHTPPPPDGSSGVTMTGFSEEIRLAGYDERETRLIGNPGGVGGGDYEDPGDGAVDMVNHPPHYSGLEVPIAWCDGTGTPLRHSTGDVMWLRPMMERAGKLWLDLKCLDVMRHIRDPRLATAFKYIWRVSLGGGKAGSTKAQDIAKAIVYLQDYLDNPVE